MLTAAKINIVNEKPLNFLYPLAANAKKRKKKIKNGPVCSPWPMANMIPVISRQINEAINKTL